jgi:hypothetical protein
LKCKLANRCADFDGADNSCASEIVAIGRCSYRQTGEFPDKLHPNKYELYKVSNVLKFKNTEGKKP